MLKFFQILALLFPLLWTSQIVFGQKGEVIVDFSSRQKPDTSYMVTKDTTVRPSKSVDITPPPTINYAGIDSLKREILALRKEVRSQEMTLSDMQMNLQKAHSKYKTGLFLFLGGVVLLNIVSGSTGSTGTISQSQAYLILGSFGVTVAGMVIMIDSHKFIGRAGKPADRYSVRKSYYY